MNAIAYTAFPFTQLKADIASADGQHRATLGRILKHAESFHKSYENLPGTHVYDPAAHTRLRLAKLLSNIGRMPWSATGLAAGVLEVRRELSVIDADNEYSRDPFAPFVYPDVETGMTRSTGRTHVSDAVQVLRDWAATHGGGQDEISALLKGHFEPTVRT